MSALRPSKAPVQNLIEALAQLLGMREIYQKSNLRSIGPRSNKLVVTNVRFGSKADMCSAQADVRFVPIADISVCQRDVD